MKIFGWAILDKNGGTLTFRVKMQDFLGTIIEREPFTSADLERADLEWAGLAPHKIVTLYIKDE